jgi:hypothetical protein
LKNNKFKFLASALIVLTFAGCAVTPPPKEKTSLEIQAIQAKTFEADKKVAFNSVLSVLQDLGYIVASASMETGFITAESAVKNDTGFFDAMAKVRRESRVAVTASVEEMKANSSRVRLNFVNRQKRSAVNGQQANDDTPLQDPKVYDNAFEKISEAIFIRKGQ